MINNEQILILGAGVSGLSTGILLLKRGFNVTIWAKDLPPNTTSNKAAAVWYPYLCNPKDKATPWAKFTLEYFKKEIISDPRSGCIMRKVIEIFDKKQPDPWWANAVNGEVNRPTEAELPEGYIDGYEIEAVVMDTSIYMEYLVNLYKKLGGIIIQKEVSTINEALEDSPIVVNCTGLGSRKLFSDQTIFPVRGQTVKIKPNGFDKVIADDEGPNNLALIIPRISDIVLGGTTQENDWNTEIDPEDTKEIVRKVSSMYPQFKDAEIISASVGLRPVRPEIRLEAEDFSGKTVIHNYGHGGAGFTLSWGCAQDVVNLVDKASNSL